MFFGFVDRASLYNRVDKANLVHNFSQYVYFFSLHVSGDFVPIIRRNNCYLCDIWCLLLCVNDFLVCRVESTLHTRPSSTQSDKYQVSHKYSCFSWWWAHSRPKHIEKRNKHTEKNCAPSWLYLQDYAWMRIHEDGMAEILAKGILGHSELVNSCELFAVTKYDY